MRLCILWDCDFSIVSTLHATVPSVRLCNMSDYTLFGIVHCVLEFIVLRCSFCGKMLCMGFRVLYDNAVCGIAPSL